MLEDITKKMDITKTFDVGITQGSYWGGAQIPYWLIKILTVAFGAIGFDHLLLRSPRTAILKVLSIIPLFGFWYFFDIAQVFGEEESVRKHGFAIPFLGPQGIGGGMFINKDGSNLAPPDKSKPWTFLIYAVATILFTVLPLNKILIGDYGSAFLQIIMYCFFFTPLVLLALFWGFYDEYRVLFDTRGLIEKGAARIFPASWILDPYFKPNALGPMPYPPPPDPPSLLTNMEHIIGKAFSMYTGLYTKLLSSVFGITTKAVEVASDVKDKVVTVGKEVGGKVAAEATKIATKVADKVATKAEVMENKVVDKVLGKIEEVEDKVLNKGLGALETTIDVGLAPYTAPLDAMGAAATGVEAVKESVEAAKDSVAAVSEVASAAKESAAVLSEKGPELLGKLMNGAAQQAETAATKAATNAATAAAATAATAAAVPALPALPAVPAGQLGGGLDLFMKRIKTNEQPSDSAMVLLFCVALLAFGGYVVYTVRKTMMSTEDSKDDTPPDSRPVRKPRHSKDSQYSDTGAN
jgi:hypothetical protein